MCDCLFFLSPAKELLLRQLRLVVLVGVVHTQKKDVCKNINESTATSCWGESRISSGFAGCHRILLVQSCHISIIFKGCYTAQNQEAWLQFTSQESYWVWSLDRREEILLSTVYMKPVKFAPTRSSNGPQFEQL